MERKILLDKITYYSEFSPDEIALESIDRRLTYLEFKNEVEVIFEGVKEYSSSLGNNIIGIRMADKFNVVPLIYGLLKAGKTILPLPNEIPDEKVETILKEIQPEFLISDGDITFKSTKVIKYRALLDVQKFKTECKIARENSVALLLMTSGTTGVPKGCLLEDKQIIGRVFQLQKLFGDRKDVILFSTNYSFDVSYSEIFAWPILGGKLVIMGEGDKFDTIPKYIQKFGVTQLSISPSALLNIAREIDSIPDLSLKHIFVAGEKFPTRLATLFNSFAERKYQVWNMYGPTEASIYASFFNISQIQNENNSVPIGKPLPKMDIKIFDIKNNKLCNNGDEGEIILAGDGIFRGYYGQYELTKKKQVEISGQTYYRTGDLGYFSDGLFWIKGRIDNQLKVNGMRIESEEIEDIILQSNTIIENAIIRLKQYKSKKILTLFFTSKHNVDILELIDTLGKRLEKSFIPKLFVKLPYFKLNKNGKIDEEFLTEHFISKINGKKFSDYGSNGIFYEKLKLIWESILEVPLLRKNDNFFQRGGDSLDSINFILEIESEFGIRLADSFLAQFQSFDKILNYLSNTEADMSGSRMLSNKQFEEYKKNSEIKSSFPFFVRQEIYARNGVNILLEHSIEIKNINLETVCFVINSLKQQQQLLNCEVDITHKRFIEYEFVPLSVSDIKIARNKVERAYYIDKMKLNMEKKNILFDFFVFNKKSNLLEIVFLFSHYIADGATINRFDKLFFDCLNRVDSTEAPPNYQTLIEDVCNNNSELELQELLESPYYQSIEKNLKSVNSKFNYKSQSDLLIITINSTDLDILFNRIAVEISNKIGESNLVFHILKSGLEYNGKDYRNIIADTHNSIYVSFNVNEERKLYTKSEECYKNIYLEQQWHLDYLIFSDKYINEKALDVFREVPFNINYIGQFRREQVNEVLEELYNMKDKLSSLQENRARVTCFTTDNLGYIIFLNGFGYGQ